MEARAVPLSGVRHPASSCPRSPRISQSGQRPILTASVRTRLHRKRVYPFAVPLRGEGVLGPGPGRAAGSIAGHAGAKPRVRRRTGRRRLSWAKLGKGQIGTGPRRRGRGPRRCPTQDIPPPNACENRSSGATATTPKLFYRRPSATAVVTVPGEIALAPPLPRPVHSGRAMSHVSSPSEGWGGGCEPLRADGGGDTVVGVRAGRCSLGKTRSPPPSPPLRSGSTSPLLRTGRRPCSQISWL
ncbi:hypothetical protein MMB232_00222 [Brevundimonas subvibrioides]